MPEVLIRPLASSTLIGRVPIKDTNGIFAITVEPDSKGVGFGFGFLVDGGRALLPCHTTGTRQTGPEFIALLRAAVNELEAQMLANAG